MNEERGNQGGIRKRFSLQGLRSFLALLLAERLEPGRAAAAVFIGVFIAIVPIYGFQSLVAIGLATILRLNRPLTFGATFVNNPLLQPFLVVASLEVGHFLLQGRPWSLPAGGITAPALRDQLSAWLVGSLVFGVIAGGFAACAIFLFLHFRSPGHAGLRQRQREGRRFVAGLFAACPASARGFVRWKMRLDRIFNILVQVDLGRGPAVDLGCGYGMALGLAAFQQPGRSLIGCDLDAHRVMVAGQALRPLRAEVSVHDVRTFPIPPASLILIIDVLQYLDAAEQQDLLKRCCSALLPSGRLIFRVADRKRGIPAKLSLALDRIIFRLSATPRRPLTLFPDDYARILESAGMKVGMQRFINRLPLAHILFRSEKADSGEQKTCVDESGLPAPVTS